MTEPFFGSVPNSPMWPGIPSPGFGLFGLGSRPFGISAEGFAGQSPTYAFTPQSYGLGGGMMTMAPPGSGVVAGSQGPGTGPNLPGPAAIPFGGFPAFGPYEVPTGITAPGLLATVAMRRGQPLGPTNDQELEEFIYEALDLLPGTNDVEVRIEGGRVTLTGAVPHKRLKRDVGEIAWAMIGVNDVSNNVTITARRRQRAAGRESESQPAHAATRKQP